MRNGTAATCGLLSVVAVALLLLPERADGVPAFARDQQVSCTFCHTVWPQLTEEGRLFKESGFNMDTLENIDDDLDLPSPFPVSARANLRLIDKRTSKRKSGALSDADKQLKLRAFHELEAFFAGQAAQDWSYFIEFEAEDEWPDPAGDAPGFQVQLAQGVAQYNAADNVAFAAGYGSPFFADPYNTVHYQKPVRHEWAPASKGFTPGASQFISASARPTEQVFVLAAWHGNGGLLEGNDPQDFSGRLVVDVLPELSVGGYATLQQTFDGTLGESDSDNKVNRFGGDVQVAVDNLNVHGLFGIMDFDATDVTESTFGIEGNYLVPVNSVFLGPVASVSGYTINDGDEWLVVGGFFVNCQMTANVRGQVGWEGDLSISDTMYDHKESRITAVVDLGL